MVRCDECIQRRRARALIGLTHMHHFGGRPFDDVIAEAVAIGRRECDAWTTSFAVFMQALAALERNATGRQRRWHGNPNGSPGAARNQCRLPAR